MIVERVDWRSLQVPFARPFTNARGTLAHRDLVICAIHTGDGLVGWGEASPWPLAGGGVVADAYAAIGAIAPSLVGMDVEAVPEALDNYAFALNAPGITSARFGLELAALDVLATARDVRIAELLSSTVAPSVLCNALIDATDPVVAAREAHSAVGRGFTAVKLKVGGGPVADDVARVGAVRGAIGKGVKLRLDANGTWSSDEAITALNKMHPYGIDLIEQPCSDLTGMARVRSETHVTVAADESVTDLASVQRIIDARAASVLVVKPAVVGGVRAGAKIAELAAAHGIDVVVTTSIEGGIGIAGALHLAASLAQASRPCGLATSSLLSDDLTGRRPLIVNGSMEFSDHPGLGVVPEPDSLERYATEPWTSTYRGSLTA